MTREEVLQKVGSAWRTSATDTMADHIVELTETVARLKSELHKIETERDILNEDFLDMKDYLDTVIRDNETLREEVSELRQEKVWLKNLVERAYWDGFEDYSFLLDRKNPSYDNWENSVTKRELDARYTDE